MKNWKRIAVLLDWRCMHLAGFQQLASCIPGTMKPEEADCELMHLWHCATRDRKMHLPRTARSCRWGQTVQQQQRRERWLTNVEDERQTRLSRGAVS